MHVLLQKLLKKRGIKDLGNASSEEKQTFDRWNAVLSKNEVSVKDISEFCAMQKSKIEEQWSNVDNSLKKNDRLVLLYTVYSKIEQVIISDQSERESLEKYLHTLLDTETS